ncbi:MAG: membrane protein insertase YidC [Oscillospiraceae bacterium]|jgi:YidC/Oxa1 family membrane protein insertase|nr:membrane protein insertase YidC [Oscillospiraceae bacterium]
MNIIDLTFGTVFGLLMRLCYIITGNFGWTIVIFTLLVKAVLFPISLISQKNSIIMVKIKPLLDDLQARYEGELETLMKEQKALYRKEKYSPLKAILPLLVQIPVIIGVISVVYNPARHLGAGIDPYFFGADMLALPGNLTVPLLAIASTALLCVIQNKYNVISREQGFVGKWGITIGLVAFTGWFSFACPSGVGLYWTYGNLFGIIVLAICNLVYAPKKFIDYENRSIKPKLTKTEKAAARERRALEKIREKDDMKRFFSTPKELVFYSDSSGFYKYFQHFIEYILENSDITVHYLTADINDQVFQFDKPGFETYFCSSHGLITTFMKMDADVVVMTMPDLEVYHYKRSLVRKDIEYIYTDHGTGSFHLAHRKGALDHYDTIFCYSKNHNEEVRATERVYGLREKKLVDVGFGLLDTLIENYNEAVLNPENDEQERDTRPRILIAPSWQKDNILECCLDPLLAGLFELDAKIIIRPHPEFVKRFPGKMKSLFDKYEEKIGDGFEIQTDFSSNSTVYNSDLVITDWSSIAQEFSFTTKKPSMFINTTMKVMNLEWRKIGIEPMEIWIRDRIGVSIDTDKLDGAKDVVQNLLENGDGYRVAIEELLEEYMYNMGRTAEAGGGYIIGRIEERRRERRDEP